MRHILCFGNPLHGDDGLGPALAARLQAVPLPADVEVFDVGTRGLDALPLLQHCHAALLVDALAPLDGAPAGQILWIDPQSLLVCGHAGLHAAGLAHLLQAAAALGPLPAVQILGVRADEVRAFQLGLSPAVAAALEAVLPMAVGWADDSAPSVDRPAFGEGLPA